MASLTVDAAMQLPGPDWLKQRRGEAAEQLASASLPSAEEEMWRYTPVADIDLDRYDAPSGAVAASPLDPPPGSAVIEVIDGHVVSVDVTAEAADAGLVVGGAADIDGAQAFLDGAPSDDTFDLVNQAYAVAPVIVRVPAGRSIPGTVHVRNHLSGSGIVAAPHLAVQLGADAQLTIVESHRGGADGLVVPRTDLAVADRARLRHTMVQQLDPSATQIGRQRTVVGAQSSVSVAAVALGGAYARLRSDCQLQGRGGSATMLGASFGRHDQVVDFRTFQDHAAADTTSELLYKNVVADRARSITTGLIRVEAEARGTVAQQTNRTIKLGPEAWAESVPNLEIENNDVKCSHASSVGPIDEDQSFYLASRGVPPAVAQRLIVTGFLDQILRRLADDSLAADLRSVVSERLQGVG
jgi:Fe-S cluster assembly protein SufD